MNDVTIKVTVPHWIAEYLMEMCEKEADFWIFEDNPSFKGQWRKLAQDIEEAIDKADQFIE